MTRLGALLRKELLDLARNRTALVPVGLVAVTSLGLPLAVAILVPALTGQRLGADADLRQVSRVIGTHPELTTDARVQLFFFEQFLLLFLLMPITGAMALAAHAIVGEKQSRTLEPLLATPITTFELLFAKVLGALVPTLAISAIAVVLYFAEIALGGEPGVAGAMLTGRTFLLVGLVAPAAALVSLQAAIVISSRVNDARTAQQFGVLIILPLTGLLVVQFTGSVWLSTAAIGAIGAGLLGLWLLLALVSVALFERDTILTRWR